MFVHFPFRKLSNKSLYLHGTSYIIVKINLAQVCTSIPNATATVRTFAVSAALTSCNEGSLQVRTVKDDNQ
jgi:hypothetical protein